MVVDLVARTVLLPVLLLQAVYLRVTVLKLPEPEGERSRGEGDGPPLRILILGDSSAAGVGVETQAEALLGQLTNRLSGMAKVNADLIARSGARTGDVLGWLDDIPPRQYDVVVTALGVNDVTKAVSLRRWLRQKKTLLDRLKDQFGAQHIMVSGLPPMHQFPLLPQPLRWVLGRQAVRFDQHLRAIVEARQGCSWITIDMDLSESNMARDGFHPGPTVYAAWADVICDRIVEDPVLLDHSGRTA